MMEPTAISKRHFFQKFFSQSLELIAESFQLNLDFSGQTHYLAELLTNPRILLDK